MSAIPCVPLQRILFVLSHGPTHSYLENMIGFPGNSHADLANTEDHSQETITIEPSFHSVDRLACHRAPSLDSGLKFLLEGIQSGRPFSMVFLDGIEPQWDRAWTMMERAWEADSRLRFVLCLQNDFSWCLSPMQKSRAGQWMVLRKPCLEEDLHLFFSFIGCPQLDWKEGVSEADGVLGGRCIQPGSRKNNNGQEAKNVELELARDELATSKSYVNNILRSMADSLFVITMDMSIGAVNPSLLTLLGYREEELIGESPGKIFGEEFAQGAIMEALMLQGSVSGVESSFLTCDGRQIPISVSGSLIQDERGQFQGMVCVAQDITERKRMEEEKRELHGQLLDTSRKLGMAEVASGVLHNVGNVLNSVNVSVGVIVDLVNRSLVGDVDRISRMIETHQGELGTFLSQHPKGKQIPSYLRRLSGQLLEENRQLQLEIARLRENVGHAQQCVAAQQSLIKPDSITEPFWLADVVEEAVLVNRSAIEEHGIRVVREFGDLPQVVFDKHQILQVLVALIRNACQAMESAPDKCLVLRIKLINGPPDSIRLEVCDSGVGIPYEDLTRIFGQGYTTKQGGRGMSLHSGALTAKNLNGALTAWSEGHGSGATLTLDLPGYFHFPDL